MNWANILVLLPTLISAVGGMINTTAPQASPATSQAMTTLLQTEEAFIKLIQEALNAVQLIGIVTFGTPLKVDGIAGPLTTAAITSLLAKFNVKF
jgi:hypothetical protein